MWIIRRISALLKARMTEMRASLDENETVEDAFEMKKRGRDQREVEVGER